MKAILFVALCTATACSAATASEWDVQTAASSSARFGTYRTFSFGLPEAPPAGFDVSPTSLAAEPRIQSLIADDLVRKGYVEDKANPQLIVRFGLGTRHESRVGPEPNHPERYTTEAIAFDLYDAGAESAVWHGTATANIGRQRVDEGTLHNAVSAAFVALPESPTPAAKRSETPRPAGAPPDLTARR